MVTRILPGGHIQPNDILSQLANVASGLYSSQPEKKVSRWKRRLSKIAMENCHVTSCRVVDVLLTILDVGSITTSYTRFQHDFFGDLLVSGRAEKCRQQGKFQQQISFQHPIMNSMQNSCPGCNPQDQHYNFHHFWGLGYHFLLLGWVREDPHEILYQTTPETNHLSGFDKIFPWVHPWKEGISEEFPILPYTFGGNPWCNTPIIRRMNVCTEWFRKELQFQAQGIGHCKETWVNLLINRYISKYVFQKTSAQLGSWSPQPVHIFEVPNVQ